MTYCATTTSNTIKKTLPAGVQINSFYDQSELVNDAIASVRDAILLGLVLASLIMVLFLRDWGTSLVAGLVIPATIGVTFMTLRLISAHLEKRDPAAAQRRDDEHHRLALINMTGAGVRARRPERPRADLLPTADVESLQRRDGQAGTRRRPALRHRRRALGQPRGAASRPPVAVAFRGCAPTIQLHRSMIWMFCSTRMSPESARYQGQLRRRYSSGEAPGR